MSLQKLAINFQENWPFQSPLKISTEISKPVTLAVFENPALLGILDTSFHIANLILTDQFNVKSWVSYQNVAILLYYLRVKEKIIFSILVWVKKTNNSR